MLIELPPPANHEKKLPVINVCGYVSDTCTWSPAGASLDRPSAESPNVDQLPPTGRFCAMTPMFATVNVGAESITRDCITDVGLPSEADLTPSLAD